MKGPERLRAAIYGAFAALAVAALLLTWGSLRVERGRANDTLLLQLVANQRGEVAELGRLAALHTLQSVASQQAQPAPPRQGDSPAADDTGAAAVPTAVALAPAVVPQPPPAPAATPVLDQVLDSALDKALDKALAQSTADAAQLDALLASTAQSPQARLAVAAWQQAHAQLRKLHSLHHLGSALQAGVQAAAGAATLLADTLALEAGQRAARAQLQLQAGLGGLALLLLVLAFTVVEPAARAARRAGRRRAEQAVELQRMALVAEHTAALMLVTDPEDRVQWANAAFTQVSGWTLDEASGRRPGELMASAHADERVLTSVQAAIRHGHGVRHEWLHRTRGGGDLWLDVDMRPLRSLDGELTGFVRVASDVTERVREQSKLQALWAVLPVGVVVHGIDGSVTEANHAALRLLGLNLLQLQGSEPPPKQWKMLRSDGSGYPVLEHATREREVRRDAGHEHLVHDHPALRTLNTGLPVRNETIGIQQDGVTRWLLVNTEPCLDALGQLSGVVACLSDITERRALQDRLSDSARTDALTLLPNRTVVMERLQRALEHGRRHVGYGFAVLFMDCDRFKQVNDTLGHAAGDVLLRQIALRLQCTLRPGDAVARLPGSQRAEHTDELQADAPVAARLGGDEFVVVLEGVSDVQTVAVIAQRLLDNLSEPYLVDNTPLLTSVSIGVVLCTDLAPAGGVGPDGDDAVDAAPPLSAEDVLRNADTAMVEAKRAGRARWVLFDDSMHERVVRALALKSDLRRALQHDELFVVYQPVVDLRTGALYGVEALVRWHHPERGLVTPGEFISVAEESGLIHALGATVLRKACMQFMHWRRTPGAPAPQLLAVNLSRAQLERDGLVDEVRTVLQDCGMEPGLLQLEVTESLAAQDEQVLRTLHALKALGVQLALDDFGTGYSSLACLHQMPVDTVKVDRSFVQHAETVEYHRVLIEATIRVARTLGMTTVAEGIETEGQAALMLALDCDRGQGFLFSRPLEAAALERWVTAQQTQQAQQARQTQQETADTI